MSSNQSNSSAEQVSASILQVQAQGRSQAKAQQEMLAVIVSQFNLPPDQSVEIVEIEVAAQRIAQAFWNGRK